MVSLNKYVCLFLYSKSDQLSQGAPRSRMVTCFDPVIVEHFTSQIRQHLGLSSFQVTLPRVSLQIQAWFRWPEEFSKVPGTKEHLERSCLERLLQESSMTPQTSCRALVENTYALSIFIFRAGLWRQVPGPRVVFLTGAQTARPLCISTASHRDWRSRDTAHVKNMHTIPFYSEKDLLK